MKAAVACFGVNGGLCWTIPKEIVSPLIVHDSLQTSSQVVSITHGYAPRLLGKKRKYCLCFNVFLTTLIGKYVELTEGILRIPLSLHCNTLVHPDGFARGRCRRKLGNELGIKQITWTCDLVRGRNVQRLQTTGVQSVNYGG